METEDARYLSNREAWGHLQAFPLYATGPAAGRRAARAPRTIRIFWEGLFLTKKRFKVMNAWKSPCTNVLIHSACI